MGEHHELPGAASGRHWAGHVAVVAATLILAPVPCLVAKSCGYTWSLLIFMLPIGVILTWFHLTPKEELRPVRRAFWWTVGPLAALGFVLNLLFADNFFVYPNASAVLGIRVPVLHEMRLSFEHTMPVEELLFYTSGFLAMLLIYVWGCESFFEEYRPRDYLSRARRHPTVFQLSMAPVGVVVVLVVAASALKQLLSPDTPGAPWYLIYLLVLPFLVSLVFVRVALEFVNWRAFSFMFVVLLADSVLWEASLAIPHEWWGYRREVMIGLNIAPWRDLPVEAVLVWVLAPFATVVTFEALKVLLHHPEPLRGHLRRAWLVGHGGRRGPVAEAIGAVDSALAPEDPIPGGALAVPSPAGTTTATPIASDGSRGAGSSGGNSAS